MTYDEGWAKTFREVTGTRTSCADCGIPVPSALCGPAYECPACKQVFCTDCLTLHKEPG